MFNFELENLRKSIPERIETNNNIIKSLAKQGTMAWGKNKKQEIILVISDKQEENTLPATNITQVLSTLK